MKNFLVNAALAVASLLVSAALLFSAGEIVLQAAYGRVPPGPPVGMNVYDAHRGWALKPGRHSYFDVKAFRRVDVVVNELGVRGGPLSPEPAPGVQRVTILGDSFVFGPPLNDRETMTSQLQSLAGRAFEILNVAVPGYGTGQQLRLVEELDQKGYRLGRTLVLVFFTNDISDNLGLDNATLERNPAQPVFSLDSLGSLRQTVPPRPRHPHDERRGLLGRSLFLQFLRYNLEVLIVAHPALLNLASAVHMTPGLPRTPGIIAGWYGSRWESRWRVTEGVLEQLARTVRGLPEAPQLFIAFVPSPFQVEESFRRIIAGGRGNDPRNAEFLSDPDRPQRMLEGLARRLEIPFIDLTPELREAGRRSLMYFPREGHFNPAGSALAARVLYQQAIRRR